MKLFEKPIIEVMSFEVQDVVTTSSEEEIPDVAMIPPCA